MSLVSADATLMRISNKVSAANTKLDIIKKNIRIAEDAFSQNLPTIDTDPGYKYYISERDRLIRTKDVYQKEIDTKTSTLEAKKAAMTEEYDRKISELVQSLEAKKAAMMEEYDRKINELVQKKEDSSKDYDGKIEEQNSKANDKREKILDAKPTSLAYRKLLSSVDEAEKELETTQESFRQALEERERVAGKVYATAIAAEKAEITRLLREEAFERQEALKIIEARRQQENDASMARYRLRETMAKNEMAKNELLKMTE